MITGAHVILYSTDAEADRAFFRDVLEYPSVDAGHGWLIFALPPAELAVHPAEAGAAGQHELREQAEPGVLDLAREARALGRQLPHRRVHVVAHEVELAAAARRVGVRGELGRREREDQPAPAGIDRGET